MEVSLPADELQTARAVRLSCRSGAWTRETCGLAPGFVQANLVVLHEQVADDFEAFCRKNPKPCPLLERTEPGGYDPVQSARGADLRTDLPRYRIYRNGTLVDTPTSIESHWDGHCVAFLLGCSFTFESAMIDAGLPVRHVEQRCNVPMYRTNVSCATTGLFSGPLVVSMRPLTPEQADRAVEITSRYPQAHGEPVGIGDPSSLGIVDLGSPDYGDAVTLRAGEVPVFWACGVTPMLALERARLPFAVTHQPGHMFVTDRVFSDIV